MSLKYDGSNQKSRFKSARYNFCILNLIGYVLINALTALCVQAQECTSLAVQSNVDSLVAKLTAKVAIKENHLRDILDTCLINPSDKEMLTFEAVLDNPEVPNSLKELAKLCLSFKTKSKEEAATLLVIFNRAYQQFFEESSHHNHVKVEERAHDHLQRSSSTDKLLSFFGKPGNLAITDENR